MGLINVSSIDGIAEALDEIETGLGAIVTILGKSKGPAGRQVLRIQSV